MSEWTPTANRPYGGANAGTYGQSLYGRWPYTPLTPCKPAWVDKPLCAPVPVPSNAPSGA